MTQNAHHKKLFDEKKILHDLKHYLPAQAPLKDFIHHNTLHAFQHHSFHDALFQASEVFGYKVYLSLEDYRAKYRQGSISPAILEQTILDIKGKSHVEQWKDRLLNTSYNASTSPRVGSVRAEWKQYGLHLDKLVHPLLFRVIGSYLDQGISMWRFPHSENGFLSAMREMEQISSFSGFFQTRRAKEFLLNPRTTMWQLLRIIVGAESLFEHYLFDQQFAHPGWSGMITVLGDHPHILLDKKNISLHDFIMFEMLLELEMLDRELGENWAPLSLKVKKKPTPLFAPAAKTEFADVCALWQEAFERSYFDQVLAGLQQGQSLAEQSGGHSFQALFCIDDRECSLRRHLEQTDKLCRTYGTPGFFNVEFYFQPEHGKFHTKVCPAPLSPKYLIKEVDTKQKRSTDAHFTKHTHTLLTGLLITQTLGFWSALKLAVSIFKPTPGPTTSYSFRHMDKDSTLSIEHQPTEPKEGALQIGFTVDEMTDRIEGLLKSIGLVENFASLVYVIGHGASSVNNTHYAGYDCGACSGRPGSVNARVAAFMANHPRVRENLRERGISIPSETQFVGGLHDTTRDEIEFYDEDILSSANREFHQRHTATFAQALSLNAKERSRRFVLMNTKEEPKAIHKKIKLRSVSLFEPRPELNHATNALCIIGRRDLTRHLFLDRRAFMNSFDYRIDPEGKYLFTILKAAAPVCGGINLEYYFSRTDNYRLGAGTKLPHNVIGLIGVANGTDGDLRPGLPSQMIEVHDPTRLLMIVEHFPDVVLQVIQKSPEVYEWFANEWVKLVIVHPESKDLYRFQAGAVVPYIPVSSKLGVVNDLMTFIESHEENLPVSLLQKEMTQ